MDFNRYVIQPHTEAFHQVSFTREKEIKQFKKGLHGNAKTIFKYFESVHALFYALQRGQDRLIRLIGDEKYRDQQTQIKESLKRAKASLSDHLDAEQNKFFCSVVLPHFKIIARQGSSNWKTRKFDSNPISWWILRRVFELGWQRDWHGYSDYLINQRHNRGRESKQGRIERIGKKYQWIAFHEIMARLSDHHLVADHGEKPQSYQGTWKPFLRDIDPTFPFLNCEDPLMKWQKIPSVWWEPLCYTNWEQDSWLEVSDDLPDPAALADLIDVKDGRWLALVNLPDWKQSRKLGQPEEGMNGRYLWYHIRAYFVHKKDEEVALNWLSKQRF